MEIAPGNDDSHRRFPGNFYHRLALNNAKQSAFFAFCATTTREKGANDTLVEMHVILPVARTRYANATPRFDYSLDEKDDAINARAFERSRRS